MSPQQRAAGYFFLCELKDGAVDSRTFLRAAMELMADVSRREQTLKSGEARNLATAQRQSVRQDASLRRQ